MVKIGEHAVVLGASMGGLLAARVLSDFYRTVTVVERDVLPNDPANRRGVPQGRHVHALLRRGAQILEELFPGFLDELAAVGIPVWSDGDLARLYFCINGHTLLRSGTLRNPEELSMYAPSRPFLECHVRRRLRAIANVTILGGHDLVELNATADRTRVTGARVAHRDSGDQRELTADLVVDAMGRGAHTPAFLESLGYGRPVEDHIVIHMTYVSQMLRMPPDAVPEMGVNIGPVQGRPSGMFLSSYEDGTWLFTVNGMVGHEPPADRAGMIAFAEEYAPAHILAAVRAAEPLGDVFRHRMPSSQWRRYDKMRRLPDGLLAVGDAICSFNPIYGQGMTVSALDAVALRDCLSRGGHNNLPRRYFCAAASQIAVPWQMGAGADLAFPQVQGRRRLSMRLMNRYSDWILTACESDPITTERFLRVITLVDTPARLLHPSFVFRVATVNLRGRQRPQTIAAASEAAR